jgi:hypothetical protein
MHRITPPILVSLVLGFLVLSGPALAVDIVPSDRVVGWVNVRSGPSIEEPVVGKLHPGEAAELLASFARWHAVRLNNGIQGFVSKAWTAEVEARPIRIGTWNIKKLGHGSSKDYTLVASIIDKHFDLLTVVEVMQKQGGHPGYDTLLTQLGSDWAGVVTSSPRPNTNSGNAELYAVLYRPDRIAPCVGWSELQYHPDHDGGPTGTGEDRFDREPAYGCFAAQNASGEVGCDFLVAAYRATWADGNEDEIVAEIEHLPRVFEAMSDAMPGEKDLLIIGDFNLVPEILSDAVSKPDRTTGTGSILNSRGSRTQNLYDHLLVGDESATQELRGDAEVLDVVAEANTPKAFYETVSDHLPIVAKMECSGADDD